MRILFTADWHIHPRNWENTVPATIEAIDIARRVAPDLFLFGGDMFDTRGRLDPATLHRGFQK